MFLPKHICILPGILYAMFCFVLLPTISTFARLSALECGSHLNLCWSLAHIRSLENDVVLIRIQSATNLTALFALSRRVHSYFIKRKRSEQTKQNNAYNHQVKVWSQLNIYKRHTCKKRLIKKVDFKNNEMS